MMQGQLGQPAGQTFWLPAVQEQVSPGCALLLNQRSQAVDKGHGVHERSVSEYKRVELP